MKILSSNKRTLLSSVALVSLLLVYILAGCQLMEGLGPAGNAKQPLDIQDLTATPPVITVPPEVTAAIDAENLLTIWLPPQFDPKDDSLAGKLLKARLESFQSINPGVVVNVRVKAVSGRGSLLDSLTTTSSVAPGALPALIFLPKNDFEIAALKGVIFPINGSTVPLDDPDWFPFTREMAEIQGVQYGIPFTSDPLVLAYRSSEVAFPPKTWQEVSQQGIALSFPAADLQSLIPLSMYISAGGSLIDTEGKLSLQLETLININQIIYNGANSGAFPYWSTQLDTFENAWLPFSEGRSKMSVTWASVALNNPVENASIAPLPSYSSEPFTFVNGWLLCFPDSPSAERPSLALQLAEYLMDPVFQQKWSEAANLLPTRRSVLAAWEDQNKSSTLKTIAESAHSIPANEVLVRVGIILEETTIDLLKQQVDSEQAAAQAIQKIQAQD
ncbi:MAG: hypothetical protein FD147_1518 [Chloroflexi bacterium]|nr:MAG: hypothetical protein FD147_1518 [Chloroflexota bacterium]